MVFGVVFHFFTKREHMIEFVSTSYPPPQFFHAFPYLSIVLFPPNPDRALPIEQVLLGRGRKAPCHQWPHAVGMNDQAIGVSLLARFIEFTEIEIVFSSDLTVRKWSTVLRLPKRAFRQGIFFPTNHPPSLSMTDGRAFNGGQDFAEFWWRGPFSFAVK